MPRATKASSKSRVCACVRTRTAVSDSRVALPLSLDGRCDKAGLVLFVLGVIELRPGAFLLESLEAFSFPLGVLGDERIGGIEDGGGRAVVLLELEHSRRGENPPRSRGCCGCRRHETCKSTGPRPQPRRGFRVAPTGATDGTACRWCPDTRRPGRAGSACRRIGGRLPSTPRARLRAGEGRRSPPPVWSQEPVDSGGRSRGGSRARARSRTAGVARRPGA